MSFRKLPVKKPRPTDIEGLFKDLKSRSPKVSNLWVHQADILRVYQTAHLETNDVALELPTGSGKTLVALLIGEFRRRTYDQRILYCCPTRQLVRQVAAQAVEYGIDVRPFVGPRRDYNLEDLGNYRESKTIAVSTYAALFNANPAFHDPQTVILDDAHSLDGYASQMWEFTVPREAPGELYQRILSLFETHLPPGAARAYVERRGGYLGAPVEMLPYGVAYQLIVKLRALIDPIAEANSQADWAYSWRNIRESLHACNLFVDMSEITIRPLVPPTLTHAPFANAAQRVYISASLGAGGDLERSVGVRRIERIPTPKTYETRGIGRRFFLFPDATHDEQECLTWIRRRLRSEQTPRSLVLASNRVKARTFAESVMGSDSSILSLGPGDIEDSLETFARAPRACLILYGRYDGIDLPHDACRQVILYGLPSGTNIQEEFLERIIGLGALLQERVRTRILQGAGRCTREDTDYAVVLMLDRRIYDFCSRTENRSTLHPELRAEISFGLEQSRQDWKALDRMVRSFLTRDREWADAEANISQYRDQESPVSSRPADQALEAAVSEEVDFAYAFWRGDWRSAVAKGRGVVDRLSGEALARYRALWCYQVACVAHAALKTGSPSFQSIIDDYSSRAASAAGTAPWFARAIRTLSKVDSPELNQSEMQGMVVSGILTSLQNLGLTGPRFGDHIGDVGRSLGGTNPDDFDRGLADLGTLLGWDAWKPEGMAAPDAVWRLRGKKAIVFEGKSGAEPGEEIPVETCRQAAGHLDWARDAEDLESTLDRVIVLVTPQSRLSRGARTHAKDVRIASLDEIRALFERVRLCLEAARAQMGVSDSAVSRDIILRELRSSRLTPEDVVADLTRKLLKDQKAK